MFLAIEGFAAAPDPVAAGGTVEIAFTVANRGSEPCPAGVLEVLVGTEGEVVDGEERALPALAPGESVPFAITIAVDAEAEALLPFAVEAHPDGAAGTFAFKNVLIAE